MSVAALAIIIAGPLCILLAGVLVHGLTRSQTVTAKPPATYSYKVRGFPTDDVEILNREGKCPECGGKEFFEGPQGGMALNIKCASCGTWWWYSPPFSPYKIDRKDK